MPNKLYPATEAENGIIAIQKVGQLNINEKSEKSEKQNDIDKTADGILSQNMTAEQMLPQMLQMQ